MVTAERRPALRPYLEAVWADRRPDKKMSPRPNITWNPVEGKA